MDSNMRYALNILFTYKLLYLFEYIQNLSKRFWDSTEVKGEVEYISNSGYKLNL
jgi:hypothetical protein